MERVNNKSEFVYLSFPANSSLKLVRGSRSPLIKSSTIFTLLLQTLFSGGPTVWLQTPGDYADFYLIYNIEFSCICKPYSFSFLFSFFLCFLCVAN